MKLIIFCSIVILVDLNFNSCHLTLSQDDDAKNPLILTPLLKSGKILEARKKSSVRAFLGNIISNSGFLTVNETENANLFFWFFQKDDSDWKRAPLLLWLEGGPGCASMLGLFDENGPYEVIKGEVHRRRYSWINHYNMLYIDSPVGSGFSFTNGKFVSNQNEVAQHLYEALSQFFQMFPELYHNEFYISGDSYAGKFIPAIAYKIYKSNDSLKINLQGLLIGNGLCDPENMLDYAEHLHRLGLVDFKTKKLLEVAQEKTKALIRSSSWEEAFRSRFELLNTIKTITGFKYLWHYLRQNTSNPYYAEFLQNENVKEDLHVGRLPYIECSETVYGSMMLDIGKSVRPWIEELLEAYPILVYSGMVDIQDGHFLTTKFIDNLHWSGAEQYSVSEREKWYIGNKLVGYYKVAGNLKYAMIRNAGHTAGKYQPKAMLNLVDKFINREL